MAQAKQDMGSGSVKKLMLQLMIPAVVAQVVNLLYNIVDRIYIGHIEGIGAAALTGVGLFTPILMLLNAFAMLVGAGGAPRTAIALGQGDRQQAEKIISNSFTVLMLFAVVLTIGFYAGAPALLRLFGASDATLPYALSYSRIYILGSVFVLLVLGMNPFITTQGFAKTSMLTTVIGAVINIILDPILIFGFGLGVQGAAIATVLSRYVEFGLILLGTHGKKTPPRFIRGLYRGFAIPGHLAGQIVRKGMPLLVNEMFWSLGMTMLTQCYSYRGLDAIAALNINSTVLNLFNTVIFTMGNTVGIIIGNLLGAEEYDRARNYCPKLAALSCAASAAVGVVMFLVAPYAPRLYNTSHEIMTLAASLMRICALMLPVHAVVNAAYWTIRAGGRTYITMLSDSVFTWVVSVPIAWVLIHKTGLPLVEAYLFVNLADLIKMVIGIVLLRRGIWVRNIVTGEEIAAGKAAG